MQGECHVCGQYGYVEKHHSLHGKNRKKCDRYSKLVVPLCPMCHRGTRGVHGKDGKELDSKLKAEAMQIFLKEYGKLKDFKKEFGRFYW